MPEAPVRDAIAPRFIRLSVRTAMVDHGFDADNAEIIETPEPQAFATKLVALDRIQSVSERYVLVSGAHGRQMYWEYEGGIEALAGLLRAQGLLIG